MTQILVLKKKKCQGNQNDFSESLSELLQVGPDLRTDVGGSVRSSLKSLCEETPVRVSRPCTCNSLVTSSSIIQRLGSGSGRPGSGG